MTIAITGHRPNKLGNDYDLKSPLIERINILLEEIILNYQPDFMISGMALGIDTLWARLAIKNDIKLIAAIPFENQDVMWVEKSRKIYHDLLSKAWNVVNVSGQTRYKPEYMQMRNEWMVDKCDILVAVWNGSKGGTGNCVQYAQRVGKKMIRIDPSEIKL